MYFTHTCRTTVRSEKLVSGKDNTVVATAIARAVTSTDMVASFGKVLKYFTQKPTETLSKPSAAVSNAVFSSKPRRWSDVNCHALIHDSTLLWNLLTREACEEATAYSNIAVIERNI